MQLHSATPGRKHHFGKPHGSVEKQPDDAHAETAVKHRQRIAHPPGVHDEKAQPRGRSKALGQKEYGNGRAAGK